MAKAMLFGFLWWITGSPFIAFIVIVVDLYFLDRRFIGILPNIAKPFQVRSRLRKIRQELKLNPHHMSLKTEAARIYISLGKYSEAERLLNDILQQVDDSADLWFEAGLCRLKLGKLAEGESMIVKALELNS